MSSFGHQGAFWLRSPVVSKIFEEIMESIEVVFSHFLQLDGFRAERLGDAMRVLGMSPTEDQDRPPAAMMWADWADFWSLNHAKARISVCDVLAIWIHFDPQVRKHLEDLGGPQYIDERTFHHFIKDSGLGISPMFGSLVIL